MPSFSASGYLRGLGWKGPGQGLNDSPHARSKPVTVVQKKTLAGVGKDRDESFPWWEMVFSAVAAKTASGSASPSASGTSTPTLQTSKTGILSNRRPTSTNADASAPTTSATSTSRDILGQAKVEAARRQLYRSFLRGKPIGGSVDEPVAPTATNDQARAEKGKAKERGDVALDVADDASPRRKKRGKKGKEGKAKRANSTASEDEETTLPTPPDSETDRQASKSAKAARDDHRKRKRRREDDEQQTADTDRKERKRKKREQKLEALIRQSLQR